MTPKGAKLAEVAPDDPKQQAKPSEVAQKDEKRQAKPSNEVVRYVREEDEAPKAAQKPGPLPDHELEVLYFLCNTLVNGAFFSELEEGTKMNPRALTKAIERLAGRGYLQSIRPNTEKGTTGKDLAADEWEHAKSVTDPEEKAKAERFASMLEQTTSQRRIYFPSEEGSLAYIANMLEIGVAQGWNARIGEPYDPDARYYRTPEGSKHFGLSSG